MPIVPLITPPGDVAPVRIPVGAGAAAPTPEERMEAANVAADDLADLARMDSDAG